MKAINPSLNVPQSQFLALQHKFRAFVAGFGSGKTWVGGASQCKHFWEHTGTITLTWSKRAWEIWKGQFDRTPFAVSFPIEDSLGNAYLFDFPSIEIDGELPNGGKRDIIQTTLNWTVAKVASTITRFPAAPVTP